MGSTGLLTATVALIDLILILAVEASVQLECLFTLSYLYFQYLVEALLSLCEVSDFRSVRPSNHSFQAPHSSYLNSTRTQVRLSIDIDSVTLMVIQRFES